MNRWARAAVGGIVVGTAGVVMAAWASGFRYGGSAPVFVVLLAVSALVSLEAGLGLVRSGERMVGRWVLAVCGSLVVYLVSTAAAVGYGRWNDDPAASFVVVLHAAGYIVPVALLQVCFVIAGVRLGLVGAAGRRLAAAVGGYGLAFAVAGMLALPVGPPFAHIQPVLEVPEGAAMVLPLPWMAGVFAGPAVAWRALSRARRGARPRALMIAVLALTPVATILVCVLAGFMAFAFDVMSVGLGEAVLAVAFCAPFLVCTAGLRRALGPKPPPGDVTRVLSVLVTALFSIVVVAVSTILGSGLSGVLPVVLGTLAVAAVLAPLRRRSVRFLSLRTDPVRARTARLVRVAEAGTRPAETVQEILRTALDAPDLLLLLRLPDERGWVTAEGVPVPEEGVETGPSARLVGLQDAADVDGCLPEVGPLIERAVLEMAVRDQAARVEEAVSEERKRLERDLHDGVQGRLLALALDLKMAQRELDAQAQLVLTDAAEGLATAIDELRALAGGTTPDLLSRRGLKAALTDLTGRMPTRIHLEIPEQRLPAPVETVAYLVVCEAVTNVLKHAEAEQIAIALTVSDGRAALTVRDDGRGGTDLRAGTGLRGLSERVRTAGGSMVVSDARPHGTVLEVILPCG
ncbi:sensor histidine kinase [Actinocorallia populi]|uniref:sensor histidine kinase n=1 Tax=Actinocorallia populi TaxID=2079200 RepID=UPI000D08E408|nr:histidine kinase [Actinocorallia populi]